MYWAMHCSLSSFCLPNANAVCTAVNLGWGFRLQDNCSQDPVCCLALALSLCSPLRKIRALNISSLCEFPFSNCSLQTQQEQIIFPTCRTIFQENMGRNKSNPGGKLHDNIASIVQIPNELLD